MERFDIWMYGPEGASDGWTTFKRAMKTGKETLMKAQPNLEQAEADCKWRSIEIMQGNKHCVPRALIHVFGFGVGMNHSWDFERVELL